MSATFAPSDDRVARRSHPAGPRADDDEIVFVGGLGVAPDGRVNIIHERAMEPVVRRSARRRVIVLHGMPLLLGRMRHDNQPPVKPARRSPLPI